MRDGIEPWLSALLQTEHLNLLIGSGFSTAIAVRAGTPPVTMEPANFSAARSGSVTAAVERSAQAIGRGSANLEDQVRGMRDLIAGLSVVSGDEDPFAQECQTLAAAWQLELESLLKGFLGNVLKCEREVEAVLSAKGESGDRLRRLITGFLLSFASRAATRDRLHVFTTNYDRMVEYGLDLLGIRSIDRFVGGLVPRFRASRLSVDMHYNPPGIRGEPRYLEGVARVTKLHGSIDWVHRQSGQGSKEILKVAVPFGAPQDHPALPLHLVNELMVYPNAGKDVETTEYPYAELFRDFAAATCRPNAVLVTYGYGFGDDHINRIIRDMLTIPSTHLAVISYSDPGGRIRAFCETLGRDDQTTLLLGSHFGDLEVLVDYYLPKAAIDDVTWRMVKLMNDRPGSPVPPVEAPAPVAKDSL
jgi:hypothetical protein